MWQKNTTIKSTSPFTPSCNIFTSTNGPDAAGKPDCCYTGLKRGEARTGCERGSMAKNASSKNKPPSTPLLIARPAHVPPKTRSHPCAAFEPSIQTNDRTQTLMLRRFIVKRSFARVGGETSMPEVTSKIREGFIVGQSFLMDNNLVSLTICLQYILYSITIMVSSYAEGHAAARLLLFRVVRRSRNILKIRSFVILAPFLKITQFLRK